MASRDSLEMRKLAAVNTVQVSRDDTPVALRMRAKGAAGAVTSVTVTTATDIVMITENGGTDTYTFAAYATVGALADAINADGMFEVVVLDALRSDTTDNNFVAGAITAGTDMNGVVVWDVKVITDVTDYMTATLSLGRNFDSVKKGHRVTLKEIVYNVNVSAAEANAVRVYLRTASNVETQVWGIASVDATATTINWADGQGGITAPEAGDIIVRVLDSTSITDAAANFVQATGILE